jgi:MraZ protein
VFRGTTQINLDEKGRMVLPARYRDELMEGCDGRLILTLDTDKKCLLLYKYPDWQNIENALFRLPSSNPAVRKMQMILQGHATDVEIDGNGRILIHPSLRPVVNLDKKIMLVGIGRRFEIWDLSVWEAERDAILSVGVLGLEGLPQEASNIPL